MKRGEVWVYKSMSRTRPVLVVSADELNEAGEPLVVDVRPSAPTGPIALLSVPLPDDLGYARCRWINTASADRLVEHVGSVPPAVMDRVDMALRAALAL